MNTTYTPKHLTTIIIIKVFSEKKTLNKVAIGHLSKKKRKVTPMPY